MSLFQRRTALGSSLFSILCSTLGITLLASGCSSTTTVAYANGTVASSKVSYEYEVAPVFKTGRNMRYFVAIQGVPSWEKIAIKALQESGMGRTAERERAKLVVSVDVQPFEVGDAVAVQVAEGFTPGYVARSWYQVRFDDRDGEELSGSSNEFSEVVTNPNGAVFASREEALSNEGERESNIESETLRRLQEAVLAKALRDAEERAKRLFLSQGVVLSVPVVRKAGDLELKAASEALAKATSSAEYIEAEALYEQANRQLDERVGGANATSRYGVLCGLAACRLMLDDFAGSWALTSQALKLEPEGKEALAIRAGIYEEELSTGKRAIPTEDRRRMDQAAARSGNAN